MKEHKHLIVRAEVNNPPMSEEEAKKSIVELIDMIDMKLLMGPFAKYVEVEGNRGLTVASIIETSHVVLHSWDEQTPAVVQLVAPDLFIQLEPILSKVSSVYPSMSSPFPSSQDAETARTSSL